MQRVSKLTIVLSIILVFVICGKISSYFYGKNDLFIHYFDDISSINRIVQYDGDYYYTKEDGVYNDMGCIIQTESKPLIFADSDMLYVYSENVITEYDKQIGRKHEYPVENAVNSFAVFNGVIHYIDNENQYGRIADEDDVEFEESKIADVSVFKNEDYIIFRSTDGETVFQCDDVLLSSAENIYDSRIMFLFDDCLIISEPVEITKNDSNGINSKLRFPADCVTKSLKAFDNSIVYVGTDAPEDPYLDYSMSDNPNIHANDRIIVIDAISFNIIYKCYTERGEKVIYCDTEKAITYFKGKYLTYSLEDWKVINKQSADEIEGGGSYTFETCGDYVFVFDEDTGELINRICVD